MWQSEFEFQFELDILLRFIPLNIWKQVGSIFKIYIVHVNVFKKLGHKCYINITLTWFVQTLMWQSGVRIMLLGIFFALQDQRQKI